MANTHMSSAADVGDLRSVMGLTVDDLTSTCDARFDRVYIGDGTSSTPQLTTIAGGTSDGTLFVNEKALEAGRGLEWEPVGLQVVGKDIPEIQELLLEMKKLREKLAALEERLEDPYKCLRKKVEGFTLH